MNNNLYKTYSNNGILCLCAIAVAGATSPWVDASVVRGEEHHSILVANNHYNTSTGWWHSSTVRTSVLGWRTFSDLRPTYG